jgi:hypothetical protein
VTDSQPVTQYQVLEWISNQLRLSILEAKKSEAEFNLAGKRLSNAAMLASGYVMQYPDYQAGYGALIASLEAIKGHA